MRGESWSQGLLNLDKDTRRDYTPDEDDEDAGFRLAGVVPAPSTAPWTVT